MKYKIIVAVIVILFLVGAVGSVWVLNAPSKRCVRVLSDGRTVYSGDLTLQEDTTFDAVYEDHVNTVEIKDHRIRVCGADCPDQTCVKMGWLSSAQMPIVCLPHKLVIEFTDSTADVDAVTR